MKRILFLISVLFLINSAYSQRFIGSIIAGGNFTQVDGDMVYGYHKAGLNAGASVMLPLDAKFRWFATVELLYTQKGSYKRNYNPDMCDTCDLQFDNANIDYPCNNDIKYKLNLDYVEVPVIFHYEDFRTGWAIGAGFAWGRLVRAKEIENGWTTTTNVRSGTYTTNDWSVLADLKIKIWKGLKLNIRYQYSFVPLRSRTYNTKDNYGVVIATTPRKEYNNVITVRLIYSFNEKYIKNHEWVKGGSKGPRWIRDTSKSFYK